MQVLRMHLCNQENWFQFFTESAIYALIEIQAFGKNALFRDW